MSDREDAHQIHRSAIDSPVVADSTREGNIDDLAVAHTDHHIALPLHKRLDGGFAHTRSHDTVDCRRRPAPLDMSQNSHPGIVLRKLLLHAFGKPHGTARSGILGHQHDRRIFTFAESLVDELAQLIDLRVHLGNDRGFGSEAIAPFNAR